MDQGRIMLPVRIHEHDHLAGSGSRTALDCGSIAHGVRRSQHAGAEGGGNIGRPVRRSVVNHDYLRIGQLRPELWQRPL